MSISGPLSSFNRVSSLVEAPSTQTQVQHLSAPSGISSSASTIRTYDLSGGGFCSWLDRKLAGIWQSIRRFFGWHRPEDVLEKRIKTGQELLGMLFNHLDHSNTNADRTLVFFVMKCDGDNRVCYDTLGEQRLLEGSKELVGQFLKDRFLYNGKRNANGLDIEMLIFEKKDNDTYDYHRFKAHTDFQSSPCYGDIRSVTQHSSLIRHQANMFLRQVIGDNGIALS